MARVDLKSYSLSELLELQTGITLELDRRGTIRTSGSVQGEIGETLAHAVYGGVLAPPGTKGYDLIDGAGRKIQVKTRTLPSDANRIFQFKSLDMDLALCIRFDRETSELVWAREYTRDQLRMLVSAHTQGPRLSTARANRSGTEVTNEFLAAYQRLGGPIYGMCVNSPAAARRVPNVGR